MQRISIEGGHPLKGEVRPSGNKNSAMPIIAAVLLTRGTIRLSNVPSTTDVINMLGHLSKLGCTVNNNRGEVEVVPSSNLSSSIGSPLPASPQASLLLVAALLHKHRKVQIAPFDPAKERVSTHLKVLADFGIDLEVKNGFTSLSITQPISGQDILLEEASVTATELAILLAVCANGTTVLRNAACEPHIQDLLKFLVACGAKIEGTGTNLLHVHGVEELNNASYRLAADHIEIASLIAMAAITRGEITITDVDVEVMRVVLQRYQKLGIHVTLEDRTLYVPVHDTLQIEEQYTTGQPTLASAPWPGFPSDLTPLAAVVASQASGSLLIHEKLFDSRMHFLDSLMSMGAQVIQCDPHRAIILGPNRLRAISLETPDVRTGLALLGAALVAEGVSVIDDAQVINRTFHNAVGKLVRLGAAIQIS